MFSGNFIPVKFLCSDFIQTPGVSSVNEITFLGSTVGKTININFGGLSVAMVASATPNDSGYQFLQGDGSAGYVASILQAFKDNYLLNENFEITQSTTKLIFTAKKKLSGFNFKAVTDASFTIANTVNGVTEKIKTDYSVYFELYLQNKTHTGFDKIYSDYLPLINNSDFAETDIRDSLDSAIMNDIIKDGVEANIMSDLAANQCKLSCRKYYFKYAEHFNGEVKKTFVSPNYTVLLGGFSYPAQHLFNQLVYFNPGGTDKSLDRFLWQGGQNINTRFDTPQFFYFYNNRENVATVNLKVKFYFTDGSNATKNVNTFALTADEKYCFNLRFDVLHYNLIRLDATINAKKVLKYEAYLFGSAKLSETLTFTVDRSYQEQVRHFLYLSSLGTLDSLTATGKAKNGFELAQQEAETIRQASDKTTDGDSLVFDIKMRHKFTVDCGWEKTKADFTRKRDFFTSPKKYRYVNGYSLPIKITSTNIDESQDSRGLDAHVLEYEYLFNETFYTELDASEPIANNFEL